MEDILQKTFKEKSLENNAVVIDVRTPSEWQHGIIADSLLIDFMDQNNFAREVEMFDKSKTYLIYCRSGMRSSYACRLMDEMGFKYTYNLMGGIISWKGEIVQPKEAIL
jgi:rhodanese-related sulfurtransferase